MKFRVERNQLADAVAWAIRAVPAKPSMPILLGVLLEVGESGLTVSAFDYETSAQADVDVISAEEGRVLVPGRLLADICRSLPDSPVDITTDGGRARLGCGGARFELPTLPVEDYPSLPEIPSAIGSLESDVFAAAVAQVAVAAERGETLPALTGVRVEIEGDTVTLVATDRYRLAVRELRWQPQQAQVSITALIRARTLADTAKSLAGGAEVTLSMSTGTGTGGTGTEGADGLVGFCAGRRRTTSRLIDAEFPKYHTLLAADTSALAVVPTAPFIDAVKRVALVAARNRIAPVIRLTISPGCAQLSAGAGDEAQAFEELPVEYDGTDITIAFNPGYLLDGLGALDTDSAKIGFSTSSKPAMLTGKDATANYRYLLMPVRVT